jgi:hypothetical protein
MIDLISETWVQFLINRELSVFHIVQLRITCLQSTDCYKKFGQKCAENFVQLLCLKIIQKVGRTLSYTFLFKLRMDHTSTPELYVPIMLRK